MGSLIYKGAFFKRMTYRGSKPTFLKVGDLMAESECEEQILESLGSNGHTEGHCK